MTQMTSEEVRNGYYYEMKENLHDAIMAAIKAANEVIGEFPNKARKYEGIKGRLALIAVSLNGICGDDLASGTPCMCYHDDAWIYCEYMMNGSVAIRDEEGKCTMCIHDAEHVIRLDRFDFHDKDYLNGTKHDYGTKGAAKTHAQLSNKENE